MYFGFVSLQFIRFCAVGIGSGMVQFGALLLLTRYGGVEQVRASKIACILQALVKFEFHREWTFGIAGTDHFYRQVTLFVLVETVAYFLNTAGMTALKKHTSLGPLRSQGVVTAVLSPAIFLTLRFIFR